MSETSRSHNFLGFSWDENYKERCTATRDRVLWLHAKLFKLQGSLQSQLQKYKQEGFWVVCKYKNRLLWEWKLSRITEKVNSSATYWHYLEHLSLSEEGEEEEVKKRITKSKCTLQNREHGGD
jgi:cobalamin biosynthesis protein CbiD